MLFHLSLGIESRRFVFSCVFFHCLLLMYLYGKYGSVKDYVKDLVAISKLY